MWRALGLVITFAVVMVGPPAFFRIGIATEVANRSANPWDSLLPFLLFLAAFAFQLVVAMIWAMLAYDRRMRP